LAACLTGYLPEQGLIQCLISVVMCWTIGGQATSIPIENQMHDIIGFSIGHLTKITPDKTFDADINYPVYIDEPLIILYLRCLFEKWLWTSRKMWLTNSLSSAHNKSLISYIFKDLVLMVLMEKFGDKFTALSNVFKFPQASTLESRKVWLVSLHWDADGVMWSCPILWRAGSSDQIGFKAETPADILEFLKDPYEKTALFLDANCGPDVISIFQDEKTNKPINASCQMKVQDLKIEMWLKALDSVMHHPPAWSLRIFVLFWHGQPWVSTSPPLPERMTPPFLHIVASPDDDQAEHLAAELKPTAILKWAVVKDYIGSVADIITTKQKSVY
jgi:hypothetical protein